jgi:hypothetical protein
MTDMSATTSTLADRVAAASAHAPLSALAPADRLELDTLLQIADGIEDLPGRWQAALLQAEVDGAGPAPAKHCCGGH